MIPFVPGYLVAIGPGIAPLLLVAFTGLACLAGSLIETGIARASAWRLSLGVPIAAVLAVYYVNFITALL